MDLVLIHLWSAYIILDRPLSTLALLTSGFMHPCYGALECEKYGWMACPGPEGWWQLPPPEYKFGDSFTQPGIYCSIEVCMKGRSGSWTLLTPEYEFRGSFTQPGNIAALKCDEWQVPRPGDREVGQDLWHALYVLVSSEHHRATDHHGFGSATHTPTPTHTGPSTLYIVQCAKVRSRISNLTLWSRPQS